MESDRKGGRKCNNKDGGANVDDVDAELLRQGFNFNYGDCPDNRENYGSSNGYFDNVSDIRILKPNEILIIKLISRFKWVNQKV